MAEETIIYPMNNKRAYLDRAGLSTYDNKIKSHISTAVSEEAALLNESIDSLENTVTNLSATVTDLPKKVISSITLNKSATSPIKSNDGVLNLTSGTNISLASEANGITITNTYTLPKAAADVLGGVKVSSNITVDDDGALSITKNNVVGALGFTPLSPSTKYAVSSTVGGSATSAEKLNTDAGSETQPTFFKNGVPVATTYTLNKTVPSDAEFTDTRVTSVENHYQPTKSGTYSVSATSSTPASWGSTSLVTGVTLGKDAAGHITGLEVSSIQFPDIPNIDASKITTGTINIDRLPASALERLLLVDNKTKLLALTSNDVQDGDSVKVTYYSDTTPNATSSTSGTISKLFIVRDSSKLGSLDAFTEYTASTYWSNISGIPNTLVYTTNLKSKGSPTQPIYFDSTGVPQSCTYQLNKTVPSDAVFTDHIYTAGDGISISNSNEIINSGVRSISTGTKNGTINVDTNGSTNLISVYGLGSAAYTDSTAYASVTHTHNYAGSTSSGGAATSAKKLEESKTIGVGTAVSAKAQSFDGTSNITIPITGVSEAYLTWGGKNFSGSYGPIDAAMIDTLGANRLAYGAAGAITIEYSRDSGSTWMDYDTSDASKSNLFSPPGSSFVIGKNTTKDTSTSTYPSAATYQLRITINTGSYPIYTVLNKFMIYVSTNGCEGCWCTISAALQSSPDTYKIFKERCSVSGWAGYNIINTEGICTYGNSPSSQYGRLRFTFGCTSHSSLSYQGLKVFKIYGFGGVGWATPSTLAASGHLYSMGSNQAATFPGTVTATKGFSGNLSGNATSANKLNTDAGNTTTPVYFKDGIPRALSYTIEKSVPADALFTDTVYTHPESKAAAGSASEGGTTRTLSYGETFNIPSVTFDNCGHITAYGKTTLTLPGSDNTWRDIWVNGSSIDSAPLKLAAGANITLSTADGVTSINASLEDSSSYVFETGTTNGTFNVTPSGGTTQTVSVYGLKNLAFKDSLTYGDVGALPDTTKYITSITKSGDTLTITPSEGSVLTFTGRTYSNATTSTAGLMSTTDKSKLDGVEEKAQVNLIEKVQVNGSELTISNKTINVVVPTKTSDITNDSDYITVAEVDGKLTSSMTYKGSKTYYADLPTVDNKTGDVWNVVDYDSTKTNWGHNYAWNGENWDDLGGNVDLSNYYTKTQSDSNYLASSTLYAVSATKGGSASSAVKLDSSAGRTNTPVYFSNGKPVVCNYSFNTSEPTTTSDDTTIPTSKAVFNAILTAVGKAIASSY